jgi:hypothetical protein
MITEDFKFRDDLMKKLGKDDTCPMELTFDPYKGVVFSFKKVSVREDADRGVAKVMFEYYIHDAGNLTETKLRKDKRFEEHLGLILNHLILEVTQEPVPETDQPNEA